MAKRNNLTSFYSQGIQLPREQFEFDNGELLQLEEPIGWPPCSPKIDDRLSSLLVRKRGSTSRPFF